MNPPFATKRQSAIAGASDASHLNEDDLSAYQSLKKGRAPIARYDEQVLAKQLQQTKHHIRRLLLSCDSVQERVVRELQFIQTRRVRLDRVLKVASTELEEKQRLRQDIERVLKDVHALRHDNRRDFRVVLKHDTIPQVKRIYWEQVVLRKRKIAEVIETLGLRDSIVFPYLTLVRSELDHLESLPKLERTQEFLRKQDSISTLRRRISRIEKHRKHYIELKTRLASEHIGFVIRTAAQYTRRGLSMVELTQEGCVGLLKAIDRFEPSKGFRLITYAEWWIREEIRKAILRAEGTTSLPRSTRKSVIRFRQTANHLRHTLGREPTVDEISQQLGITADHTQHILAFSAKHLSLEHPLSSDESFGLSECIEDWSAFREQEIQETRKHVRVVLRVLDKRERDIIEMRYGFKDGQSHSLSSVASQYALSRERIRQIEAQALAKLRNKRSVTIDLRPQARP